MNDIVNDELAQKLLDKAKASPEIWTEEGVQGFSQDTEYSDTPEGNA